MYALGMKLARFSNSPQEKQDFQGKSQKVWNFLTNKTGILNGTTFQVFSQPSNTVFENKFKKSPFSTNNLTKKA